MSEIHGGMTAREAASGLSEAQIRHAVERAEEADRLEDWSDTIAGRMGDNFDGDETQEGIIDRWLDLIEFRMREHDPAWYRFLFESGPDPRDDDPDAEDPVTGAPWRAR
jgi:hypothetical protein